MEKGLCDGKIDEFKNLIGNFFDEDYSLDFKKGDLFFKLNNTLLDRLNLFFIGYDDAYGLISFEFNNSISTNGYCSLKDYTSCLRDGEYISKIIFDEIMDESYHSLYFKLENELPDEFEAAGIDYLVRTILKRSNAKYEYGQIFSYKTGEEITPEYKGTETSVVISVRRPLNYESMLNDEEKLFYVLFPDEFSWDYTHNKKFLAVQHNHTKRGLYAPSPKDILYVCVEDWADFSFVISEKELWIIDSNEYFNFFKNRVLEEELNENIVNLSKFESNFIKDKFLGTIDEKNKLYTSVLNKLYGERLVDYFRNSKYDINLKKVVL